MKKHVRLLFIIGAVFTLTALSILLKAQVPSVSVNFNQRALVPGSTIQVPVVMDGNAIGNWQLILNYDRSVLTYVSTSNTVAGLGGFFSVSPNYSNANLLSGQPCLKATYAISNPGLNYSNQTIMTITFTYNGGGTNLLFTNISSLTTNTAGWFTFIATYPGGSGGTINLGSTFTNGSAAGPLHSVAAGGSWKNRSTWTENAKPNALCDILITGEEVLVDSTATCSNLTVENGANLKVNQGINLNVNGNFILKTANPSGAVQDPGLGVNLKGERVIVK